MRDKGIIKVLLLDLQKPEVGNLLEPSAALEGLYVYESKTGVLVRLAQTPEGADALVGEGVFEVMGKCGFIDKSPHEGGKREREKYI